MVSIPENRTQNDKAVPTKWRMAFLEPPGLRPRICVPARRARGSLPSKGGEAEPPARRRRMGYLGDASGQAEMDAVANLCDETRGLGRSRREGQHGTHSKGHDGLEAAIGRIGRAVNMAVDPRRSPARQARLRRGGRQRRPDDRRHRASPGGGDRQPRSARFPASRSWGGVSPSAGSLLPLRATRALRQSRS